MPNEPVLPTPLSSRTESATVYRRGALVTRRAELPADLFAQGNGHPVTARLVNLPMALQDCSVRVRIEPLNGTSTDELPTVSDLRVTLEAGQPDADLRPPKNEELEAARMDVSRVMAELKVNEDASTALEEANLVARPKGEKSTPPPESPVEARFQFIAFRQEHLRALQDERSALLLKLRQAEEHRRVLEDREKRATQARSPRAEELRKTVIVTFRKSATAGKAPAARMYVEYLIAGATWAPGYGLQLGPSGTKGEWSLRALVAQNTGEDWKGVRLTLSTALPQRWTELPELPSIRIGRRQQLMPRAGWRPAPQNTHLLFEDYARAFLSSTKSYASAASGGRAEATGDRLIRSAEAMDRLNIPEIELKNLVARGDLRAQRIDGVMVFRLADVEALKMEKGTEPTCIIPIAGEALGEPMIEGTDQIILEDVEMQAPDSMTTQQQVVMSRGMLTGAGPSTPAPTAALDDRVGDSVGPAVSRVRQPSMAAGVRRSTRAGRAIRREVVEAVELTAQRSMLDYGLLHLAAPGEGRPVSMGRLCLTTREELYLRLIRERRFEWSIDLEAVVSEAERRAHKTESLALGSGYTTPPDMQGFDYAYPAEMPVDIPSDGEKHAIPVLTRATELRRIFVAVPREAQHVFRCVEFRNPLEAPLLAGPVDVMVGGDFLMTVPLTTVPPGGNVSLGLGVEEAIRVARNTSYTEEASGLLGGELQLTHHVIVSVQNHLSEAAEIEVRERIPHVEEEQKDEKIRVSVKSVEPSWQEYKQEEGGRPSLKAGYRWRLVVQPSDKREMRATYTIAIPSRRQLAGGNRREEV